MTLSPPIVFMLEGIVACILCIWLFIRLGKSFLWIGILSLLFYLFTLWWFGQIVWLKIPQSINPWLGTIISAIGICLLIWVLVKSTDILWALLNADGFLLFPILIALVLTVITDGYLLQKPAPTVEITITPTEYSIGDDGTVTLSLANNSNDSIKIKTFELVLPKNFLQGFIIDYSALSPPAEVAKDNSFPENYKKAFPVLELLAGNDRIVFPAIELLAGEKYEFKIPIIANSSGDYSDIFSVRVSLVPLLGENRYFQDSINIIILP